MSKFLIGISLLRFTLQHWKYLIFEASSDETGFFFDTLTERAGLWNE